MSVASSPLVVYARVPLEENAGRAGVHRARAGARQCLALAARQLGASIDMPTAGPLGAPRVNLGAPHVNTERWHVSLAHTPGLVAAAVSRSPVGIDAEWTGRIRLRAALESTSPAERELLGSTEAAEVLRLWTAKESVLKQLGYGLTALSRCRLSAPPTECSFTVECDGAPFEVECLALASHWLSVSAGFPATFQAVTLLDSEDAA